MTLLRLECCSGPSDYFMVLLVLLSLKVYHLTKFLDWSFLLPTHVEFFRFRPYGGCDKWPRRCSGMIPTLFIHTTTPRE